MKINSKILRRLVDECDKLYLRKDFNRPEIQREWQIRFAICNSYGKYGRLVSFDEMEKIMIENGRITA